jgi:hypothetical protein
MVQQDVQIKQLSPKYIGIKIKGNNPRNQRTIKVATQYRLKQELKFLYVKKQRLSEHLYKLHLECASSWPNTWDQWKCIKLVTLLWYKNQRCVVCVMKVRSESRGIAPLSLSFGAKLRWLEGVGSLLPGKARYPLYRRLGGPHGRYGRVRKIPLPPGFDPRIVQPVVSRYTDWAIPARNRNSKPKSNAQHLFPTANWSSPLYFHHLTFFIWRLPTSTPTLLFKKDEQVQAGNLQTNKFSLSAVWY